MNDYNNYTLYVKCLSPQTEQVLTELSCDFHLEGSAVAAAAGLAPPATHPFVPIATNVLSLVLNGNQNQILLSICPFITHI
jgi:hypothetical protein